MIGTVPGLRAYAQARGFLAPELDVDALTGYALQRASDYIETFYVSRFDTSFNAQSPNVESAVYEAAMLELDNPGFWNKTHTPGERKTLTEVQGIRWEIIPDAKSTGPTPISARIEALLSPYIRGAFGFYVI